MLKFLAFYSKREKRLRLLGDFFPDFSMPAAKKLRVGRNKQGKRAKVVTVRKRENRDP